jgi:hypothetical protein
MSCPQDPVGLLVLSGVEGLPIASCQLAIPERIHMCNSNFSM